MVPSPVVGDLSEEGRARYRRELYRRSLTVVAVSQVLSGAGLTAGAAVGALLAQDMLGGDAVAGLPAALFTLGSALAAFVIGRFSQVSGRRAGLAGGFLGGAVGAAGIVLAAVLDSPALLLPCLFVYGAGTASNLQARYAGTDLAPPELRATAASIALVSTTFGAVAGPNAVGPLGRLALAFGVPALAGPFMLAAVAYGSAATVLLVGLRPDPLLAARALSESETSVPPVGPSESGFAVAPRDQVAGGVMVGATVMLLTQIAMVAIMTMTPVHMRNHHHSLGQIGFVIGMHVAAMFLPSLITGRLVDRVGRVPMAIAAGVILLGAGVMATVVPATSMVLLTAALMLLGLGWNLGLISGTALIVDSTPVTTRARTQGTVDVLIALSGASGAALSGVVVGVSSFAVLSLASGLLALLLIPVVARHQTHTRPACVGATGRQA